LASGPSSNNPAVAPVSRLLGSAAISIELIIVLLQSAQPARPGPCSEMFSIYERDKDVLLPRTRWPRHGHAHHELFGLLPIADVQPQRNVA
jgi:hypothetical protein